MDFTSLNPYQRLMAVRGDDATDLAAKLREIKMRYSIVAVGNDTDNRPYALISGDILEQPKPQTKLLKKFKGA